MGFADDFESFRGPGVAGDFEAFRSTQSAAQTPAETVEDKPWYNDAGEVARQAYWSTYHGVPLTLLKAARGIVTASGDDLAGDVTNKLSEYINFFDNRAVNEMVAPDLDGRGAAASTLIKGASNIGPSLAGMGAAAINPVLGGAAVFAAFGGAQYDDTYQRAIKSGLSADKAHEAALMAGLIEGGGETIGDLVGAKAIKGTGGLLSELVGQGSARAAAKAATDSRLLVPFLRAQGENLAVQTATEYGQGAGEAAVEAGYGIRDESGNLPDWAAQGAEGAQAAVGMSILLAPFGLPGAVRVRNQNRATANALADPNTDIEQRAEAVKRVYGAIAEESPEAAKAWASHAALQLVSGQAIDIETGFDSVSGQADAIIAAKTPDEAIAASEPTAAPTPVVADIAGANSVKEALDNLPTIEDIEGLLTTPIAPPIPPVQVGIGNVQTGRMDVTAGPAYDAAAVMPELARFRKETGTIGNEAKAITPEELSQPADASWEAMAENARNFLKQWVEAQGSGPLQRLRDAAKRLWLSDSKASTDADANLLQALYESGAPIRDFLKSKADSNGQITLYRGLRNSTRSESAPIIESFTLSEWVARNFAGKDGEVVPVKVDVDDIITLANEPEQEILVRPSNRKVGAGETALAPRQAPPEAINRPMASNGKKEKRVLPLTLDGATRTANRLTNMGYPSRVIPHGEVAGRYRVVAADSPDIDNQAHAAATSPHNELPEPTPAQKEAGNYAKGHVTIDGMDISIENPQGSVRKGGSGKSAWKTTMQHHYGYIRGTVGRDKDHIDVFIKPGTTTSPQVFVVDQINPSTEKFDEHKVVLGAATEEEAAAIYRANYGKDWRGLGEINAMSADAFRKWLASGKTDQPISYREPVTVRTRRKTNSTRELLQAIISLGGLNVAMKNDVGGDSGARYRPGLFTRNGTMDLDLLAEELIAYGYDEHIPTATGIGKARELEDLIRRALGGERILASGAEQEERERAERAPIWDEARAAGIRTAGRKFNDVLDDVLRLRQTMQQRAVEALDEQARKDYDTLVGEARALMVREVDDILESIPDSATPREAFDYLVANLLPLVESRIHEVNGELHIAAADQLREENERRYIEPAENDQATGEQPGEAGGAATGDRRDGEASFLTSYDRRDLEAKAQREQDEQVAAQAAAERERDVFALTSQAAPQRVTGRTQQGGMFTPDGRAAADAKGKPPDEPVAPQPTETVSSEAVVTFDDRLRKATEGKTVTVNAKVAGFETVTPLANQDAAEVVSQLRRDVAALDALRICMGA